MCRSSLLLGIMNVGSLMLLALTVQFVHSFSTIKGTFPLFETFSLRMSCELQSASNTQGSSHHAGLAAIGVHYALPI